MLNALKKILIPVDFTVNTEVAVAKAVTLIEKDDSAIFLVHVLRTSPFFSNLRAYAAGVKKLETWKRAIEESGEGIAVHCQVLQAASVQQTIEQLAREIEPDIIVIGQSAVRSGVLYRKTIFPMKLAEATDIPVLTVKPGALHKKMKTVVVPVNDSFPESKLQALKLLCRRERLTVHLITMVNEKNQPSDFSASALLEMYRWLKTHLHCPVEYAVVHGSNKAKAILRYAEKMNADILLVNPDKETRIGWGNRHISDVLPRSSQVQVLAVVAAH